MEESGSFSQSPFSSSSPSSTNTSSGGGKAKKIIFLVIILLILGAIAYGATVLLGNTGTTPEETPSETEEFFIPTDTPTPAEDAETTPSDDEDDEDPTPTEADDEDSDSVDSASGLDRADLTIVVQNGSGEAGVAKVMADKLTALGYVVSSTGNADNYDYESTVIQVKSADRAFLALLRSDLEDDYTIGTATSDYTGSGDALIIVGAE